MSYRSSVYRGADNHVYYNATIFNNSNVPVQAIFKETRPDPIISNCNNYHMSVIRFTIPNVSQPILFWPTVNNDFMTPDNTRFIVTIQYNGVNYPTVAQGGVPVSATNPLGGGTYLKYQQLSISTPVITGDQFGIFNFEALLKIINFGIKECYDALVTLNPGLKPTLQYAPYMVYDMPNSKFNIVFSDGFINSTATSRDSVDTYSATVIYGKEDVVLFNGTYWRSLQNININHTPNVSPLFWVASSQPYNTNIPQLFYNATLFGLFENFRIYAYGYTLAQSYRFFVYNTGINKADVTPASIGEWSTTTTYVISDLVYYKCKIYQSLVNPNIGNVPDTSPVQWQLVDICGTTMVGQWSCLSYWQDMRSLRIATSLMPVSSELLGNITNSINNTAPTSENQNYRNIVTDFEPNSVNTSDDSIRTDIKFLPTAEFRLINLNDTRPLKIIDLQFYWIDVEQIERPLYINPGNSATLKIMFREKV